MKSRYYIPEFDIIRIKSADVIASSGDGEGKLEDCGEGFGDSVPW